MKNRFQIKSFIIATFFLVAYSNVFAKQVVCNWSSLFEQNTSKSSQHDDDCKDCEDEKASPLHHNDEKEKKEAPCCNDKTTAFFASQGNHIVSSFDFKNTSVTENVFFKPIFVCNPNIVNSKNYISYSLPPPKIPDIRVFIQSFII